MRIVNNSTRASANQFFSERTPFPRSGARDASRRDTTRPRASYVETDQNITPRQTFAKRRGNDTPPVYHLSLSTSQPASQSAYLPFACARCNVDATRRDATTTTTMTSGRRNATPQRYFVVSVRSRADRVSHFRGCVSDLCFHGRKCSHWKTNSSVGQDDASRYSHKK